MVPTQLILKLEPTSQLNHLSQIGGEYRKYLTYSAITSWFYLLYWHPAIQLPWTMLGNFEWLLSSFHFRTLNFTRIRLNMSPTSFGGFACWIVRDFHVPLVFLTWTSRLRHTDLYKAVRDCTLCCSRHLCSEKSQVLVVGLKQRNIHEGSLHFIVNSWNSLSFLL